MQLTSRLASTLFGGVMLLGGVVAGDEGLRAGDAGWRTKCALAEGWKFCFEVPPSTDERREGTEFKVIDVGGGTRMQFGVWESWTGSHWDSLVANIYRSEEPPPGSTDAGLLDWAGLWDASKRAEYIAKGNPSRATPKAFKTSIYVDSRGRRWARGVRRSRELRIPYVRVEQQFSIPVDEGRLRLMVSISCSEPHPNCRIIDALVANVVWSRQP